MAAALQPTTVAVVALVGLHPSTDYDEDEKERAEPQSGPHPFFK